MRKGIFTTIGKVILSAVLAMLALTLFSMLYYNLPYSIACEDGVTNYKWQENTFFSRGTEGFASGRTNNDGYACLTDYTEGTPVDYLIMGSSHMEAMQVAMNESTAGRLQAMTGEKTVYNAGVSGHMLTDCVCNLEAALTKYQPREYVILETSVVTFADADMEDAIAGIRHPEDVRSAGISGFLKRNPYLRLLINYQLPNYRNAHAAAKAAEAVTTGEEDTAGEDKATDEESKALLRALLEKVRVTAAAHDTRVIILYHPNVKIEADGTMIMSADEDEVAYFRMLCEENGLTFLDVRDRFLQEYAARRVVPYGFTNSAIASGHLNREGHAMIAEELYRLIEGQTP